MPLFGLPTLEKSWQFDVNQFVTGAGRETHHREVLFAVKESLINFALSPWTVAGSNDTVTAGMDAVDRWLDPDTDIKFSVSDSGGTKSRSWIVLQNVEGGQLLIDCRRNDNPGGSGNSARDIYIQWSPTGGYTGGSTTTHPTATDNRTLCSNAWLADINGAATFKVHVLGTTDGATTIVLFTRNSLCTARWIFTTVIDEASAIWTLPYIADASHAATSTETRAPSYSELFDAETFQGVLTPGGIQFNASLSTWASVNDGIGQRLLVPNDFTGENPFLPIGVVSTTVGARARLGRIPDLWFGNAAVVTGTPFPADNTYQFAQFGDLIVPWNGVIPEVA